MNRTVEVGAARRSLVDGTSDDLIREEPLLLQVGGMQLLTMRTPGDEIAWAVGFLASEGVITGMDDVEDVSLHPARPGSNELIPTDTVQVVLRQTALPALNARLSRTHEIRPSCGVCGLESADGLLSGLPALTAGRPRLKRAEVIRMVDDLAQRQALFQSTGACHGAALFDATGELLSMGEDVGRHNALDKAIGHAVLAGNTLNRSVGVLSGRAGYELIIKLLRVGCPVIVSVSAASALALDLCREAGATLVGFARGERMKVYWDAGRLIDA